MIFDSKPGRGTDEEAQALTEFARLCHGLGWHKAFSNLGGDTLLVVDAEVLSALEGWYGAIKCHTCCPPEPGTSFVLDQVPQAVTRVLFLCRNNEWQLTNTVRQNHQNIAVMSLVYDIMPLGKLVDGHFPEAVPEVTVTSLSPPRNILLSMAGCDVEYLAHTLEQNNFPPLTALVSPALAPWLMLTSEFRLLRFMRAALEHTRPKDGAFILDMNVIAALLSFTPLRAERLTTWLDTNPSRVLYFGCRDKVRFAALNQMLREQPYSSLWDRSERTVSQIENQAFDMEQATRLLPNVFAVEIKVELLLVELVHFKMIVLEELVQSPEAVLEAIGQFWGFKVPRKLKYANWHARYRAAADFVTRLEEFRQHVMRIYGLEDLARKK